MTVGIIILVIIILFFFYGYKMGLLKAIVDLFSFFLSWVLTWLLHPYLAAALIKTPMYDGISEWIVKTLNLSDNSAVATINSYIKNMPLFVNNSVKSTVYSAGLGAEGLTIETVLTILIINIISIVILFFTVRAATLLFKKIALKFNKVFLLGWLNKLLGGVLGAIQGAVTVYLLAFFITFFPASEIYTYTAQQIKESKICGIMFNGQVEILGIKPVYPVIQTENNNLEEIKK